jgi:hypothetical protein
VVAHDGRHTGLLFKGLAFHVTLFWLVFHEGKNKSVIIQPAGSIIAARMRALLAGIKGEFQEGHELDPKTAKKVPKGMIGRVLSRTEATALLKNLG